MVRKVILTSFAFFIPLGVQAQGRGSMPAFHAPVVAPSRVVVAAPRAGSAVVVSGPRAVAKSGAPRSRVPVPVHRNGVRATTTRSHFHESEFGLRPGCGSAPGLGFDAVHQSAVCGPSGSVSRRLGQVPLFFPFFDDGFLFPGSSVGMEESGTAEEQQMAEPEVRERTRRYIADQRETAPAEEAARTAPPDNDEFVFVRRDGRVFFAVAYSWEKGTLRYITSEGFRQTVTQDALDLDATRQFNEQRGLNFRLPA